MTIDTERLRHTLEQLHQQLDQAESLDPEVAAQLEATINDLRATLARRAEAERAELENPPAETAREEDDETDEHSLAYRLGEAEQYFESSHPTLANTVKRLVDILAQMGI